MTVDDFGPRHDAPLVIQPTEAEIMKRVRMIRGGAYEELVEFDWDIIGPRSRRVEVPLDRPTLLRRYVPDQLRALATFMEQTMDRQDLTLRSQPFEIGAQVRITSRRIDREAGARRGQESTY